MMPIIGHAPAVTERSISPSGTAWPGRTGSAVAIAHWTVRVAQRSPVSGTVRKCKALLGGKRRAGQAAGGNPYRMNNPRSLPRADLLHHRSQRADVLLFRAWSHQQASKVMEPTQVVQEIGARTARDAPQR